MTIHQPIAADRPRLVRATAASWTKEREAEARERGYRVEFEVKHNTLTASFWNGPYFCFDREWRA